MARKTANQVATALRIPIKIAFLMGCVLSALIALRMLYACIRQANLNPSDPAMFAGHVVDLLTLPSPPGRRRGEYSRERVTQGCARSSLTFVTDAEDIGSGAVVAGVEDAGEFVVGFEKGVGFVDHECRPKFFDGAVEG
jgi:hypothetical protein